LTYLGFITEGKLAAIFIKPSLGVSNWAVIYIINTAPPRAVRYKLSLDAKFVASPINIRDKDYDFFLYLSYMSIVEKEPFCGTEN
jgi:hypothetical protein